MRSTSSRTAFGALALCAALVPLVYLPDLFEFALLPRLFLLQFLLLAGVAALAAANHPVPLKHPVLLPALCYAALSTLSVLWSINPVESLVQAGRLFTFLVLLLLAGGALSASAIRTLWAISAAAGAAVSGIGIAQYFGWGFSWIPTVGNPSATFGYRNFAASYLAASIPAAAAFAWTSASRNSRLAWSVSAVLMSLFLVYTRTRGAWLGLGAALLAGTGALLWLRLRHGLNPLKTSFSRKHLYAALCGLLLVAAGAALPHRMRQEGKFRFDERKTSALTTLEAAFSPADARGRPTLWKHTLEMVRDHPFLGVGLGNWQYAYPLYDRGDWITSNAAPQRPHNDPLWILSETGLAGFACYAWMLLALFTATWRGIKKSPASPDTLRAFGIALGVLALVGHSCFSFPRERVAPSFVFWMGLATAPVLLRPNREPSRVNPHIQQTAFGLAALLLIAALYTTCRQIRFDAPYLQAVIAWRQQNWPRAADQSRQALEWGPFNHRAMLLRGRALDAMGQSEAAVEAYLNALRYQPNDGHAALAAAYETLGRHAQAAQHYETETRLFPRSADAAHSLARTLLRLNRWNEAAEAYRKALALAPESPDLYTGLGNALQAGNRFEAAAEAYAGALRLAPDDPVVSNNLGAVLARLGRLEEAERAYRQALALRPGYARAYHNLGDLYAAKSDTPRAISAYESFLHTWEGDERYLELARQKIRNLGRTLE